MDFNQVRYFLAVSETLNFTRAAEQCHVTQPALTQAIKRLESELGGELIDRNGRYTELTRLGKSLQIHFQQIDRTRQLVRSTAKAVLTGVETELNIGVMCTIGPVALSGLLKSYQLKYPMISIVLHDVTPSSIEGLLLSGALDGAFCSRHHSEHTKLRYFELFDEPIVAAFPKGHPFSLMESVPLPEIANHRYVDRLHCEFREDFMQHCVEANLELDVSFRSQREDWIQSLIRDGMGISVIPIFSLLRPTLDYRPIADPNMSRRIEFSIVDDQQCTTGIEHLLAEIHAFDWQSVKAS